MNKAVVSVVILAMSAAVRVVVAQEPRSDLVIHLAGFDSDDGAALLALVNSRESYESRGDGPGPFRSARIDIVDASASIEFSAIPFGEYAVRVFHDENGNGELDTGFMGIPKEAYGFSNDARASFGPPDYSDAVFIVDSENTTISIHLD